ncbi:MAG: type II toxin-antitoxin system RelE/ParE family toxin [Ferruginibacter sp.]
MISKLTIQEIAKEELKEAVSWYEEKQMGLGEDLNKEVTRKIELIAKSPLRYPARRGYYIVALIKIFPYLIVYRYNKNKNLITILAVFHTSRNPKNKYRQ